jgi:CubicO group peptidase (beta-lactamase class C family)
MAQSATAPTDAVAAGAVHGNLPVKEGGRALTRDDLESWLDGYVPRSLKRGDIAGAVIVVVKDGQVVLQKGYGYSDVATRRPFDAETTLLRPGSVSKLMTWTAVMQLVEQGKINLDADVNTYLDFKVPPFHGRPVTMRNLMTHTPGFQAAYNDLVLAYPERVEPLGVYLKRVLPDRVYTPGEVPAYSNYGVALAGYIVQRVSGAPFEDYMDQHVLQPLGMNHSTFRQPLPATLQPYVSNGYRLASDPAKPYEMFSIPPAGSSAVTAADMSKFMIAHLQDGEYNGQRILRPETVHLMHDTRYTTIGPSLHRMLLGFYEYDRNGHRIIGHDGDSLWFHSVLQLYVDEHVGLFISMNSIGRDGATRALRNDLEGDFADRYFPGETARPAPPVAVAVAKADATKIAGRYYASVSEPNTFLSLGNLLDQTTVTTDGTGHIQASSLVKANGELKTFEEIAPFVWQEVNGKERLAAKLVDGKVVMWGSDLDPTGAYLPVSPAHDSAWLVPALIASILALLLTGILWPVGVLVRRHFGARFALEGRSAHSHRWINIGALASGILMVAWLTTVGYMAANLYFSSALKPWLLSLHLLSDIVFPLTTVFALWNAWQVWSTRRGWRNLFAWIWSVVLVLASGTLLWVALAYHLVGVGLKF